MPASRIAHLRGSSSYGESGAREGGEQAGTEPGSALCGCTNERPPTSTRWHPTSRVGASRGRLTASSKASPIRHQRGCGQNSVPVRFDDPLIDIGRESEIVRVDDQSLRNSKQRQFDPQEFFRIGANVLRQGLGFPGRAVQRFVELRVHQQLSQRALPGVDPVDAAVQSWQQTC